MPFAPVATGHFNGLREARPLFDAQSKMTRFNRNTRLEQIVAALIVGAIWLAAEVPSAFGTDRFSAARDAMVAQIQANAVAVGRIGDKTGLSAQVLNVMRQVPRHLFVSAELQANAYEDRPLPIGYGQTISQPYIVALMTDLLEVKPDSVVLEIGTGSGYQAAILSRLARRVYTIEIVPELAEAAGKRLESLGFQNVAVRQGDGYYGWPDQGPFDCIVVTAAAGHIPPPLIQRLKPNGRMIIPVGAPFFVQQLMLVNKDADGTVTTRHLLPVRFVPLTGGH